MPGPVAGVEVAVGVPVVGACVSVVPVVGEVVGPVVVVCPSSGSDVTVDEVEVPVVAVLGDVVAVVVVVAGTVVGWSVVTFVPASPPGR